MWYVLAAIAAPLALYLGCCFVIGFVQGFVEGLRRPPLPKFHHLRCLRRVCLIQERSGWHGLI